jgi:hypothetical protein
MCVDAAVVGYNAVVRFGQLSMFATIGFGAASWYNPDPDMSRTFGYIAAAFVIPGSIYFVVSGAVLLSSLRRKK